MTNELKEKTIDASRVETNYMVLPSHANSLNSIFGGVIMSWIDIVAAISAQRHSGGICVTASVDALHFIAPVQVGDTVTLKAEIVHTGRTSMTVKVIVHATSRPFEVNRRCVKAYLTFVALNEQRQPAQVPSLKLKTEEQKEEFQKAAKRRQKLLEERKKI